MRLKPWVMLAGLGLTAALAGCSMPFAKAPVVPPVGFLYENVKAPLTVDFKSTAANPPKEGTAQTRYICAWPLSPAASVAFSAEDKDAAIQAAAKQGGITKVAYADYEVMNVLGVYSEFTIHAYGE